MTSNYVWKFYCSSINAYESVISPVEPTICPNHGVSLDPQLTSIMDALFYNLSSEGYVNIESVLSDSQAIKIHASNINGGIDITSGLGGIEANTTNSITLSGGAESRFTTSNGNLILESGAGLVNIDAGSGINIGNNSTTTPINMGTSDFSKVINIGNFIGTSQIYMRTGTGGYNVSTANGGMFSINGIGASSNISLNTNAANQNFTIALLGNTDSNLVIQSNGTGTSALNLNTNNGGIQIAAFGSSGPITISTANTGSGIISLSGGVNGTGSINMESGSSGISINAYNGGAIGIGHWSGGDLYIGTTAVQRTIYFGNTGNTTIFQRFGTGIFQSQSSPIVLGDNNITLTPTQLLSKIIQITPITNRILTLPTASILVSSIPGIQTNDSFDFSIINLSNNTNNAHVTLEELSSTFIGSTIVYASSTTSSGSALFRIHITNINPSTESYTVYRIS